MTAVMSVTPLSTVDYLNEAQWLCKRVPNVWYVRRDIYDPKLRDIKTVYRIYRRGMGQIAERSSPPALVAYLRKQLPTEAKS